MLSVDQVIKRHGELKSLRAPHEAQWREIARLMVPEKEDMFSGNSKFTVADEIYDATAMAALESFSGGIFGQLTNPANRWFEAGLDDPDLARWHPVREWLWACEQKLYATLSPTGSAFYSEVSNWFTDLGAFGMGCVYQEEDVGGGRFRDMSVSLGELYIDVDEGGQVDTVHREFKLRGDRAKRKFPELAGMVGVNDQTDYTFVHCVCPNPDLVMGRLGPEGMPVWSAYACENLKAFSRFGAYWEMPYHVVMWKKRAGRVYPVGPGHIARPDTSMLQEMERTHLVAAQFAAEPPLLVEDDAMFTAADVRPNALLYGGMNPGGKQAAIPLQRAQNLQLSMQQSQQRRDAIREAFFFGLMQLMQRPQMTATEFLGFQEEKLRLMAPNLARIQNQGLSPFLSRRFRTLMRAGAFPPPPEELAGRAIEFAYTSPLAKMQKAANGRAVLNWVGSLGQIVQATGDPGVMDVFDGDKAAEVLHDAMGPPISIMRSPADVAAIRQRRAEAQGQQRALEQGSIAAEIDATTAHAAQARTLAEGRPAP